jgi:hypothetical protein
MTSVGSNERGDRFDRNNANDETMLRLHSARQRRVDRTERSSEPPQSVQPATDHTSNPTVAYFSSLSPILIKGWFSLGGPVQWPTFPAL